MQVNFRSWNFGAVGRSMVFEERTRTQDPGSQKRVRLGNINSTIGSRIRQNAVPGSGINPLYAGKFQVLELWRGWEKDGFRRNNQNSECFSSALAH
jgi:hypothetical protein